MDRDRRERASPELPRRWSCGDEPLAIRFFAVKGRPVAPFHRFRWQNIVHIAPQYGWTIDSKAPLQLRTRGITAPHIDPGNIPGAAAAD
jgi:hypothetical protein